MPIPSRNDRHDSDATECRLIHVSHHLWREYKRASGEMRTQLEAALETVWAAKREYRAELKLRREEKARQFREYWASREAA